jgi:hypothetical protein
MPRTKTLTDRKRLNLDIPKSLYAQILKLQKDIGAASVTEVIRRSVEKHVESLKHGY